MTQPSALLQAIEQLPVTIESADSEQSSLGSPGGWQRLTTTLVLGGGGYHGRGEDVAYSTEGQKILPAWLTQIGEQLTGTQTFGELSERLNSLDTTPPSTGPSDDKPQFHRWAIESAVLDLALQQAQQNLATLTGTDWHDVTFSLSMGLGSPANLDTVNGWIEAWPQVTFKLDTSSEWTDDIIAELASTGAVRVVDFKGLYSGDWIDNSLPADRYARIASAMPSILLEDSALGPADSSVRDALGALGLSRLAWDYPITSVESVSSLELRPAAINIKPSRFGTVRNLLETIGYCIDHDIPLYAGGQYELGIGRTQAQSIASLWYSTADNDIAPAAFHGAAPAATTPNRPVSISTTPGFGWMTAPIDSIARTER